MSKESTLAAPTAAADHVISVSTSAALSSGTFKGGEEYTFVCDQGCSLVFGSSPTATTNHPRIPANTVLRFGGITEGHKVSIIADAAGTAYFWREN